MSQEAINMRKMANERGEGRVGTIFALTLLAVFIYLGVKVVPVMINTYAFKDFIEGLDLSDFDKPSG